jgi:hypothetical protein
MMAKPEERPMVYDQSTNRVLKTDIIFTDEQEVDGVA